jgi:YjbE family integral membrane protein
MELIAELQTPAFWTGLLTITWVNVILSGDNAVVIALAARSLPKRQQGKAVFWGAGAAVVLRIVLTIGAVELLKLPFLKIIGGALLFWIAIKLLLPEDDDGDVHASSTLIQAIKTILIADLAMSLDNVLAVAAVAGDSFTLLIIGLALSIPLVVFGATLLMKLIVRWPAIITVGAALLGWVAGEMIASDPILVSWSGGASWLSLHLPDINAIAVTGAILVLILGKLLVNRPRNRNAPFEHYALEEQLID